MYVHDKANRSPREEKKRRDTHISEEGSLFHVLALFLLTCTVAWSVCFRPNQTNRTHYQQHIYKALTGVATMIFFDKIINNEANHSLSLDFSILWWYVLDLHTHFFCVYYVYACIWYGIAVLLLANNIALLSFLCRPSQFLLDNVIYSFSASSFATDIIFNRKRIVANTYRFCFQWSKRGWKSTT